MGAASCSARILFCTRVLTSFSLPSVCQAPGWNPFPVAEVDWAPNGHEAPGWVGGRSGRVRSLVRRARRCWQALDAAPLDSGAPR